jgi:hypothetical protein
MLYFIATYFDLFKKPSSGNVNYLKVDYHIKHKKYFFHVVEISEIKQFACC